MTTAPLDFLDYRHYYLRVNSEGQNRLTISTFLGGLTFASFAALLSAPAISSLTLGTVLGAVIDVLLGVATFLFLLTAASTYMAIQHVAQLSPSVVKILSADPPAGPPYPELDSHDKDRLSTAYRAYAQPRYFIPLGLWLIFISLLLIGFQINWVVGLVTTVIFIVLLWFVRTLLHLMTDRARGTATPWLRLRRRP